MFNVVSFRIGCLKLLLDWIGFVFFRLKKNLVMKVMIFELGFGRRGELRYEWFICSDKSILSILCEF